MRIIFCLAALVLSASSAAVARPRNSGHNFPGHARATQPTSGLLYYGGRVISNPKVYVVWWGAAANISAEITKSPGGIDSFFEGVLDSPYIDSWAQYATNIPVQAGSALGDAGTNQLLGRGNYAGTYTLSPVPAGNVTDAQIQTALENALNAGTLPPRDANTIYAIYFPGSVSINLDQNTASCSQQGFGGYHDLSANLSAGYLVIPDCNYSFASFCAVSSHELAEAATDLIPTPGSNPDYPQAWNDSQGNEAGDLCETSGGHLDTGSGTFAVQGIWDQRSMGCKLTAHAAQDFSVAAAPHAWKLAVGATATINVQTALVAGAAQPIALSVQAPAGVTAQLAASSVDAGESTTLTLTGAQVVEDAQLIVTATEGSGPTAITHTAALLVGVVASAADYSIALSPSTQQVTAGTTATYQVQSSSDAGTPPQLALRAIGLPTGATATFSPATIAAGANSTLSLATAGSLRGSIAFDVVATSDTTRTASASLALVAPQSDAGPGTDGGVTDGGTGGQTKASSGCNEAPIESLALPLIGALLLVGRSRRRAAARPA